eukprot:m.295389 g.295389  ORF g.295389 m.295389 type:complete len:81 (+) comp55150_c0_seq6:348-590(+)
MRVSRQANGERDDVKEIIRAFTQRRIREQRRIHCQEVHSSNEEYARKEEYPVGKRIQAKTQRSKEDRAVMEQYLCDGEFF